MKTKPLDYRSILGTPKTRAEVLKEVQADKVSYAMFQNLTDELKEELIAFCMGNRGLRLTYDPFFKYIFNPALKGERLSEFLSLLLGEKVEIVEVLPKESDRISDESSLVIMDILVRLKSGAYADIEIQKIGYLFQGERCACYSSDLLMRQLSRERAKAKRDKKKFSYKSLEKVYTIVLMEKSTAVYWNHPEQYIHHSKQVFDTGLELDLLQEYFLIPLDIFREIPHNKISKLDAWLYVIGSDSPKDICRVIEAYPEFKEIYNELLMLRYKTRELIEMYDVYREALRAADEGTVQYMVEEQRKELEEQKKMLAEQEERITEQKEKITEQEERITEQEERITEQNTKLTEKDEKLAEREKELTRRSQQLQEERIENERLKELLRKANIPLE